MNTPLASRIGVVLAVLLSLLGLVLSAVLLQHHVVLKVGGDPLLNNVCEATESASCDEVLASKWAYFAGLPTSLWGLFFFAAMVSWFITIGRPVGTDGWLHIVPLLATAVGAVGCIFLAYVMYFKIPRWCPLCAATHVTTLFLFIVSLMLWFMKPRTLAITEKSTIEPLPTGYPYLRLISVALLLAGAVSVAAWSEYNHRLQKAYAQAYYHNWMDYENDYELAYQEYHTLKQEDIPISPEDPVRGPIHAPHTVVVFTDFQCPYCRGLEHMLGERLKEFPGRFRIVYKHFPMNKKCNKHVTRTLHAGSCAAAVAAEAVLLLKGNDAFWRIHDVLFDKQKSFSLEVAYQAAEQLGIDRDTYLKRIRTMSVWKRIYENVEQAHALGIKSTPVMYLDGRKMAKWGDRHLWKYLVQIDEDRENLAPFPETRPGSQPATQPQ